MDAFLFCKCCGSFREIVNSGNDIVTCQQCNDKVHIKEIFSGIRNAVEKIPIDRSELLLTLYGQSREKETADEAVIDEDCPKCGHNQLSFHTAQLRGVDEGQTIFYTCRNIKCGHKFTIKQYSSTALKFTSLDRIRDSRQASALAVPVNY